MSKLSLRSPTTMLAAGAVVLTLSLGVRHAFGLFMAPMGTEQGIGREAFGLAIALQNLVWGLAQPFAGRLADRVGAARAVLVGGLLYALGLALMARSTDALSLSLSAGLVIGLALSGTTFPVVFGAIARAMPPEKRSMAMGVAMSVGSLGQFAMLPAGISLIDSLGWSATLVLLAVVAALMMPLSVGLREAPAATAATPPMSVSAVIREAAAHRGFWLLAFGFFVCGFHVVFIATHLPAYLGDAGLPARTGAMTLALVGLFNILGSYLAGAWGARMSKPRLLAGIYFARALLLTAFVLLPLSTWTALGFGALMGVLWLSTVPLTNGTVASVFGVANLSMLGGIVFLFHQLGAFLGGWLGGWVYETTGSYQIVWWVSVALALLAGLLNLPIREQPVARLKARAA